MFLVANHFAQKLNEKRLEIAVSATFYEPEYTIGIINRDEVYLLSLEYNNQKVQGITLEQWNVLAEAVYGSYELLSFVLDEELVNA